MHNIAHQSGTLFEGPYHIIKVDSEEYLRHLCRYIHANPIRHGIATDLSLWPYSNYLEWINARPGTLVDRTFIHRHFPTPTAYQAYVQVYLTNHSPTPNSLTQYLDYLDTPHPSHSQDPQSPLTHRRDPGTALPNSPYHDPLRRARDAPPPIHAENPAL